MAVAMGVMAVLGAMLTAPPGLRLGVPARRPGPVLASEAGRAEARLSQLQRMIETGANEERILSMLADEDVGIEECQAMLEKIQELREAGEMVEVEGMEDQIRDSVDLEDIDSTKTSAGDPRVIDVTDSMASSARPSPNSPTASSTQKSPAEGEHEWGRWRQTPTDILLDLFIADGIKARDVVVEVVEGWLIVRVDTSTEVLYEDGVWGGEEVIDDNNGGQPPIMFGRFAQPVIGSEVVWLIDEDTTSGCPILSIELPKAKQEAAAVADCIFDETLLVNGKPCLAPGLSQGYITMKLPRST
eukprot:scaffold46756_cov31-Tisochrysis_lutea.AAC.1